MDRPKPFSMIREFHLADWFTLGNACAGMGALFAVMTFLQSGERQHLQYACALIPIALAFDVLDGRIARRRHSSSPLGRELDSLADVISFGVAPAALAFAVGMSTELDVLVLLYFVACGISRLARFNVTAAQLSDGSGKVAYFEGTPIPTSTVLVLGLAALAWFGSTGSELPFGVIGIGGADLHPLVLLFALSGSLMISKTLRIPKP